MSWEVAKEEELKSNGAVKSDLNIFSAKTQTAISFQL